MRLFSLLLLTALTLHPVFAGSIPPAGNDIPAEQRKQLEDGAAQLKQEISGLRTALASNPELLSLLPDVEIYHKAVDWPLRYHELIDVKKAQAALKHGLDRAAQLKAGKAPWLTTGGVRAYVSKIDGSIQPYILMMPADYKAGAPSKKPHRLDFFFHGRGEGLTELAFISAKLGEAPDATGDRFTVHPYGRYCCANKFAGEVDTFEILDAMKKQYPIDENRVVATGFSMGGAAAWHMAAHHANEWAAASPGAGFCETRIYQKMDASGEWAALPWWQKKLFHLYDCPDYARNLSMCPTIAYAGELDPQQQSGAIMEKACEAVGVKLERISGPKTGHKYEPGAKKELDKRLDEYAAKGRDVVPAEIHFETWTLRYNKARWITVDGMEKHWDRARVDAKLVGPNASITTANVSALTVQFPPGRAPAPLAVTIDGAKVPVPPAAADGSFTGAYAKVNGQWSAASSSAATLQKRHALQGPIDDAFYDSFLIVTPTGRPLNDAVGRWAKSEAGHASAEWRKIFRGIAPVKRDTELTDADMAANNLVIFGDPSSNAALKRIADKLPIKWDAKQIALGDRAFPADHHAVVMIYPNPLNPQRYVVLNSGFTFRQADHRTNSRQVAKLPDYAVIDLNTPADDRAPGAIPLAGFFDESWQLQRDDGRGTAD